MATGEEDISGGHDEIFEWNCSRCEEKETFVEAVVFCQECGEYYCEACRSGHAKFPALRNHKVLGKDSQELWGTTEKVDKRPGHCVEHNDQVLSMYCGGHDFACCPVCANIDHRNCADVVYIPHVAKDITNSREWRFTMSENTETAGFIKKIKTRKANCRAQIVDYKSAVLGSIEEQRRKVNDAFDKLKAKAEIEMAEIYQLKVKKIEKDIEVCENVISGLQDNKELMVKKEGLSDKDVFLNFKQCRRQLKSLKKMLPTDIADMPDKQKLEISMNPELQSVVDTLIKSLDEKVCTKIPHYEYSIKEKTSVCIRSEEDERPCIIGDVCVMANGNVLLSDNNNNTVKELDPSFNVKCNCRLQGSPRGLCCVDRESVVVALSNKTINFISTENTLHVTNRIELSHYCYGVAHSGDRLYVSDGAQKVYVYCMSCTPLGTVDMYVTYFQSYQQSRLLATSIDGTILFAVDEQQGLVATDRDDNILSTLKPPGLQTVSGICLDSRGSVFISGVNSDSVIQLDSQGKEVVGIFATRRDGLELPAAIGIVNSSLVVASHSARSGDSLSIFELQLK